MRKKYRKLLIFPLCLAMMVTLMTTPAFAYEVQTELSANEEFSDPIEESSDVHVDTPLDGNWCFDEKNHWRADAVSQGIPAPHVDDDNDGICDVCQYILSEPIERPNDEPLDGGYEYDDEYHWPAGGIEYKRPHEFDENGACVICDFVKSEDDRLGIGDEKEEPTMLPGRDFSSTSPKTEDKSDFALWTVILLLSASALTAVVLTLRKRSKQ